MKIKQKVQNYFKNSAKTTKAFKSVVKRAKEHQKRARPRNLEKLTKFEKVHKKETKFTKSVSTLHKNRANSIKLQKNRVKA